MTALTKLFHIGMVKVEKSSFILIGLWLLAMIAMPFARWGMGNEAIVWGVNLTVALQVTTILVILNRVWGFKRTFTTTLIVVALSWFVEAVGTATGFPFGNYTYTGLLQPQIAHVPLILPFAWMMMLPCAWAVAYIITGGRYGLRFILISALAMTAWDLFLDPQMVSWRLWMWHDSGGYFGIPWMNYLGWFLASAFITLVARPHDLQVVPFLVIYTITWALESIGLLVFWGLPGPALVGFVVMGIFVWQAWSKLPE